MDKTNMWNERGLLVVSLTDINRFPKLLSLSPNRIVVAIPKQFNEEIYLSALMYEDSKINREKIDSILTAIKEGYLEQIDLKVENEEYEGIYKEIEGLKIEISNELMLKALSTKSHENIIWKFYYNPKPTKDIINFCKKNRVNIIDNKKLKTIINDYYLLNLDNSGHYTYKYYLKLKKQLSANSCMEGILLMVVLYLFIIFFLKGSSGFFGKSILEIIFWQFNILMFGLLFYIIKEKRRILYGVVEIIIGVKAINFALLKHGYPASFDNMEFQVYITMLTGMYLLIRGIDNLFIGAKDKTLVKRFKLFLKTFD